MMDYTNLLRMLKTYEDGYGLYLDAAAAIEALQAKVDRLTKENRELAADRPEMEEVNGHWEWKNPNYEQHMPKRGEWVEDTTTYAGPGLSNYKCSLCGKICGTWRIGLKPSELPNWCGNCGADMRAKMEVQDG